MKILNLYAGIGGNRKLWGDEHEVVAVENDEKIAQIYNDFFPQDKIYVRDAHEFLLNHWQEFDFIWSSPPCPSHSRIRNMAGVGSGQNQPIYPDMKLYEEIIFLKQVYNSTGTPWRGKYVVENVVSYYEPLILPAQIGQHYFWANFLIPPYHTETRGHMTGRASLEKIKGFDLSKYTGIDKVKILRNCVEPEVGKHILDYALKEEASLFSK